jgi:lipoate-protein ligase B
VNNLEILDLGTKDYKEVLDIQYQLIEKRLKGEIPDTLIFVEHPHVLTLGRKSNINNIFDTSLPVYHVERGGDVTYHGPGQIVGYPIFDINKEKDINKFLRNLEEVIIESLKDYGLIGKRIEKYTGVWINDKKIASIGIAFKNWISYHGFALNVATDLNYFYRINPCGLESAIMTSMENLLSQKININELKVIIFNNMIKIFRL